MAGNLSDGTTVFLSSLSVGGLNSNGALFGNIVAKEISALSGLQTSTLTASTVSVSGTAKVGTLGVATLTASSLSIGVGGSPIVAMSSMSSLVGAFVVQGSASSFTGIAWAAAKVGDIILVGNIITNASSISSGLVAHSHVTVNGQIEFRLSNVSTLVQNQSAQSWVFTRISPF